MSISVSPVYDGSGTVVGAVAAARDITIRKWTDTEREEAVARGYQAERIEGLRQLAGAAGHDFSLLLGEIMGCAAGLAEAPGDDPAVQAGARRIHASAGRGARIARDLLVFGGRDPARPGRADLNTVLAGSRGLLRASVGTNIELRLITAPDLPGVMVDRGQIEQVLVNLAVNAREAMPDGGILTFTTRLADPDKVQDGDWSEAGPGHYVELAVSDTGCGMNSETMRHLFEPFFTTKQPGEGFGFGLSTVYGLITKAGGGITIDSDEDKGTTFHIYLPAVDVAAPASPVMTPPAAPRRGEAILVVDGELAALELAARILRHNGYRTTTASSAEEALSLLSSDDFQLVLIDARLPGPPGPAVADRVLAMKPGIWQ